MTRQDHQLYEFGPFQLHPGERLLLRNGEPVELTPKAFDTLLVLVENAGHLLRKGELMRRMWPDSVVEESNLTLTIHTLRKKLSNGHDGAQYIETVPRHGYRFLPIVKLQSNGGIGANATQPHDGRKVLELSRRNEDGGSSSPVQDAKKEPTARTKTVHSKAKWPLLAALLLTGLGVAAYWMHGRRDIQKVHSVAVLPFRDLSPISIDPYLADAISEELISSLARLKGIRVTARTSAFQFRSATDVRQIAKALNVDAVLEGSIRQTENQLHITAQLVDAKEGYGIWSGDFDSAPSDLLALQQRITKDVAQALKFTITAEQEQQIAKRPTFDHAAYALYLQARYFFSKRDAESMKRSAELFKKAIERDENFALAHSGLAETYAVMAANGQIPYQDAGSLVDSEASTAIGLDATLAGPHAALGLVKSQLEWDFPAADEEFRRALELDTNDAAAHHWRGLNLISMQRFPEAEEELRKAQLLDPLTLMIAEGLYESYFYARRYDDAAQEAQRLVETDPHASLWYHQLANAYLKKGKYAEALAQLDEAEKRTSERDGILSTRAILAAYSGDRATAELLVGELKEKSTGRYVEPYFLAAAYSSLGDKDSAFLWLDRELQEHDPGIAHLKFDPYFDSLRSDSRYKNLLATAGLERRPGQD